MLSISGIFRCVETYSIKRNWIFCYCQISKQLQYIRIISLVVYISTIDRDQITTSQSVSRLDNKRYAQTAIFELCHGGMIVCENETETSVAGQVWSGLR